MLAAAAYVGEGILLQSVQQVISLILSRSTDSNSLMRGVIRQTLAGEYCCESNSAELMNCTFNAAATFGCLLVLSQSSSHDLLKHSVRYPGARQKAFTAHVVRHMWM